VAAQWGIIWQPLENLRALLFGSGNKKNFYIITYSLNFTGTIFDPGETIFLVISGSRRNIFCGSGNKKNFYIITYTY
jgi:hypothetical protein